MSLYSDYMHEIGWGVVETDRGFSSYRILGKECYIQDVYVKPEYRRTKEATYLGDRVCEIAKKSGCTHVSGTVDLTLKHSEPRIKFLLSYGFKIFNEQPTFLVFSKEL